MTQPTSYKGLIESLSEIKSLTVNFDRAVSGTWPALRFPAAGRVLGAYVFADVAASGTNQIQVGLINGGVTGVGTITTAPQSNGTILAGSAYSLAVSTVGPEIYAAGELCMLNITTLNATTDVTVQIDYHIDAF